MTRIAIVCLVSVLSLGACATVPPATEMDRARGYDQELSVAFDAARKVLIALNAEIVQSDREGGVLVARTQLGGDIAMALFVDPNAHLIGTYRLDFFEQTGTLVNLRISVATSTGGYPKEGNKAAYQSFWAEMDRMLLN